MTERRPILIFDGDCGFCTTAAKWSQQKLGLPHVEPWQSLDLEEFGVTADQCSQAVQWVDTDSSVMAAERAVVAALGHAGRWWKRLGSIVALPGMIQLAGVAYRLIAKYRYRLPGGTPACAIGPHDK